MTERDATEDAALYPLGWQPCGEGYRFRTVPIGTRVLVQLDDRLRWGRTTTGRVVAGSGEDAFDIEGIGRCLAVRIFAESPGWMPRADEIPTRAEPLPSSPGEWEDEEAVVRTQPST